LLSGIFKQVRFTEDIEMSFEADPRVTTEAHISVLAELGFKRISYGVQDFDPKVQEIVNRVQSVEQVEQLTYTARKHGYQSVNFDLIYGLPLQTKTSVRDTIEEVRRMQPDRIAFYSYAHVPWIKPSQRKYTEADLPSGDEKRALYELGREMLEANGYLEIGMDHFALKEDGLSRAIQRKTLHRNFMGYMPKYVHPMISLGMSAIGDSWQMFMQNIKELEAYQDTVNQGRLPIHRGHILTEEDQVLRKHVLNIMTRGVTAWSHAADYTDYLEQVPALLQEPANDDLVSLEERRVRITEKGLPFLRNICMAFDARLNRDKPDTQLFSSTI
jgi:oxygen-independent coproporphyrinogen-3 oxidase